MEIIPKINLNYYYHNKLKIIPLKIRNCTHPFIFRNSPLNTYVNPYVKITDTNQ